MMNYLTYALLSRKVRKHDVITVVAVNALGEAGHVYSSVSASRTVALDKPFIVEKVEVYGRGFGHSSDGTRYSGSPALDYLIDGEANPTLPKAATQTLGVSATYTTPGNVEVVAVTAVAVFYGRWA